MMTTIAIRNFGLIAAAAALALVTFTQTARSASDTTKAHTHKSDDVYRGYFSDSQIKARALGDWEGDWQSVYPYLKDGTLDVVMEHKAKSGDKSAEEYRAYYDTGYRTDVDRLVIDGGKVSFHRGDKVLEATYVTDGHEILTYKKGNRGVRYIFKKADGDADAPMFIQFSDHHVAPEKVGHYHLYWGDDRAETLKELTNWPTYYPAKMTGDQIVEEMLAH